MTHPWLVILAVILVGAVYVVFPVCLRAFLQYRKGKTLNCPVKNDKATLEISASWAALTSAYGNEQLKIINCSLWPGNRNCQGECLKQL